MSNAHSNPKEGEIDITDAALEDFGQFNMHHQFGDKRIYAKKTEPDVIVLREVNPDGSERTNALLRGDASFGVYEKIMGKSSDISQRVHALLATIPTRTEIDITEALSQHLRDEGREGEVVLAEHLYATVDPSTPNVLSIKEVTAGKEMKYELKKGDPTFGMFTDVLLKMRKAA